jgi:UDPglucose 6-dehydrogenase
VIGDLGITGSSSSRMFSRAGHDVSGFDVARGLSYPHDEIAQCEFAVLCLPTPQDPSGCADLRAVCAAVDSLPEAIPVLLRSTVPPGTSELLSLRHLGLLAYCPEFMYERPDGAWSESWEVPYMLLGGTPEARAFFTPRLEEVYPGKIHQCPSTTAAELAKYTINLYWATKVTFVNEMSRVAQACGVDWEDVRAAWTMDPRVNDDYTRMKGFPSGFGGRCWPKDLSALITHTTGYEALFLEAVQEANRRFTEGTAG